MWVSLGLGHCILSRSFSIISHCLPSPYVAECLTNAKSSTQEHTNPSNSRSTGSTSSCQTWDMSTHFIGASTLVSGHKYGDIFHVVNGPHTNHEWVYRAKKSSSVTDSLALLVAVKIGVMDPRLHKPLADRLAAVSVEEPVTCRLWLVRALQELDNEGWIRLKGTVNNVEIEAVDAATRNRLRHQRSAVKSMMSKA